MAFVFAQPPPSGEESNWKSELGALYLAFQTERPERMSLLEVDMDPGNLNRLHSGAGKHSSHRQEQAPKRQGAETEIPPAGRISSCGPWFAGDRISSFGPWFAGVLSPKEA